jgi:hypothetical protein
MALPDEYDRFAIENELRAIEQKFTNLKGFDYFIPQSSAPRDPDAGVIAFSNGNNDGGTFGSSAEGFYYYSTSSNWTPIGVGGSGSSMTQFVGNQQESYKASEHTWTHGLGQVPDFVQIDLICKVAELNFTVGQTLIGTGTHSHASESNDNERGYTVIKSATTVQVLVAEDGLGIVTIPNETPRSITNQSSVGQAITVTVSGSAHAQARVRIAGYSDNALNGEFPVTSVGTNTVTYTTSGFTSGNFSGSPTLQVIGDSGKIGDNDTNATNSHWYVKARAFKVG